VAGPREDRVEIGYVARAHGIRGELRVVMHDPGSTALDAATRVFVGQENFTVAKVRATNGAVLVTLKEVADRNRAEELKGRPVEVLRDELDLEDEVLLADLVGCSVVLESGQAWGKVAGIDSGPGQDRLVIHHDGVERLLPAVDELILDVDLEAERIVVDPPEGLPEVEIPVGKRS